MHRHLDLDSVVIANVVHATQDSNTLIEVRHLLQARIRQLVCNGLQALLQEGLAPDQREHFPKHGVLVAPRCIPHLQAEMEHYVMVIRLVFLVI